MVRRRRVINSLTDFLYCYLMSFYLQSETDFLLTLTFLNGGVLKSHILVELLPPRVLMNFYVMRSQLMSSCRYESQLPAVLYVRVCILKGGALGTERLVLTYLHVSKNEVGHQGTFRLLILLAGQVEGWSLAKVLFQGFVMSRVQIHTEPNGSVYRSTRGVWCIFLSNCSLHKAQDWPLEIKQFGRQKRTSI